MMKTTRDKTTTFETSTLSSPELGKVFDEIEAIKRQTAELVRDLSSEQLAWRPAAHKWSIADCLAHLNATNEHYFQGIRRAIEDGRAAGLVAQGQARHGFLGNLFIRTMEPPVRLRLPAPKMFLPALADAPADVLTKFLFMQDELQEMLRECEELDLGRVKVSSPISSRLKFTLGQALRLLTAHERRHLWQASGVRQSADFPQ